MSRPFIVDGKQYILDRIDVDPNSGCWNWNLGVGGNGYPVCNQTWLAKSYGVTRPHQLSYSIFVGEIPPNRLVCHKCDNRRCVNPKHLFLGSYRDNNEDMGRKGRRLKKLTLDDISYIKHAKSFDSTAKSLADAFGVCQSTIYRYWKLDETTKRQS